MEAMRAATSSGVRAELLVEKMIFHPPASSAARATALPGHRLGPPVHHSVEIANDVAVHIDLSRSRREFPEVRHHLFDQVGGALDRPHRHSLVVTVEERQEL